MIREGWAQVCDGKIIAPETPSSGSAFVVGLSPDKEWLYLALTAPLAPLAPHITC